MKRQKHIPCSGTHAATINLLELLKERSNERLTKVEAYLDLVDKASARYVPKDLCRQEFTLAEGQFVVTITELSECWHWHRATVRTFIEQLEALGQVQVQKLTKSQVMTVPWLCGTSTASPYDTALAGFRQMMREGLSAWRTGKMSASDCAVTCERLYDKAVSAIVELPPTEQNGKIDGHLLQNGKDYKRAFCAAAITSICEATFHRAMTNGSTANPDKLLCFFENELGSDWESLIEAAKVLADLTIEGRSVMLNRENETVKEQFQSLCKPFLTVLMTESASSYETITDN